MDRAAAKAAGERPFAAGAGGGGTAEGQPGRPGAAARQAAKRPGWALILGEKPGAGLQSTENHVIFCTCL